MNTKLLKPAGASIEPRNLLSKAVATFRKARWMSPTGSLVSTGSSIFGRNIEAKLQEVREGRVIRLKLRNQDAAVVMSVQQYEEMLNLKELYSQLLQRVQDVATETESGEYEELYQRITSAKSRNAADILFSASSEDLRKSFKPGRTESI